jgi:hypothetical protein
MIKVKNKIMNQYPDNIYVNKNYYGGLYVSIIADGVVYIRRDLYDKLQREHDHMKNRWVKEEKP